MKRQANRRGAVIIFAIAAFAIVTGLSAAWAKRIISDRREVRRLEERVQARWLAEAGVRRASARLGADATYDGEEWDLSAADLERSEGAVVAISVKPAEDDAASSVLIVAQARYPAVAPRVRVTKRVVVDRTDER